MSQSLSEILASQFDAIFNCTPAAPTIEPEDDAESLLQAAIEELQAAPPIEAQPATIEITPPSEPRKYSGRRRRGGFNPNWRKVKEITVEANPRTGNLEIRFPNKPADMVLQTLRDNKWRWNPSDGCWYAQNSIENIQFARSLKSYASLT